MLALSPARDLYPASVRAQRPRPGGDARARRIRSPDGWWPRGGARGPRARSSAIRCWGACSRGHDKRTGHGALRSRDERTDGRETACSRALVGTTGEPVMELCIRVLTWAPRRIGPGALRSDAHVGTSGERAHVSTATDIYKSAPTTMPTASATHAISPTTAIARGKRRSAGGRRSAHQFVIA
jgi:hypothetical protein